MFSNLSISFSFGYLFFVTQFFFIIFFVIEFITFFPHCFWILNQCCALFAFSLIFNLGGYWIVFYGEKTDSTLFSNTFSWSPRAGITFLGPWRFINFNGEQSANAMWCHSDWWQLCGRWRHADRCGSISQFCGFLLSYFSNLAPPFYSQCQMP